MSNVIEYNGIIMKSLSSFNTTNLFNMPINLTFPNTSTTASGETVKCTPLASDISWMLVSTVLVLGMLPGLSFFEAGLLRGKNTISITVQIFSGTSVLCTMWILFGYSFSFCGDLLGIGVIGDLTNIGLMLVRYDDCYIGTQIPTALFALFQMMFAAITPLLMTGAFAERLAWRPFIILMLLWELIVYYPVAHWVWSADGWLNRLGAQDFAGGIVIHVTAGVSSLVSVLILGKRNDFDRHHGEVPYSSLPIACIGASLLWTGWFGFNGGSALIAGGLAIHAVMNSQIAASICSCCFLAVSLRRNGRPSMIAIINGAIAGLAGITPCAGFVSLWAGIFLSIINAILSHIGIYYLKNKLKIDDALDVSCVHGIPGLIGAIWAGIFANTSIGGKRDGLIYGNSYNGIKFFGVQILACVVCGAWSGIWTFIIMKAISRWIPLRVSKRTEISGLDLLEHNETAWQSEHLYNRYHGIKGDEILGNSISSRSDLTESFPGYLSIKASNVGSKIIVKNSDNNSRFCNYSFHPLHHHYHGGEKKPHEDSDNNKGVDPSYSVNDDKGNISLVNLFRGNIEEGLLPVPNRQLVLVSNKLDIGIDEKMTTPIDIFPPAFNSLAVSLLKEETTNREISNEENTDNIASFNNACNVKNINITGEENEASRSKNFNLTSNLSSSQRVSFNAPQVTIYRVEDEEQNYNSETDEYCSHGY